MSRLLFPIAALLAACNRPPQYGPRYVLEIFAEDWSEATDDDIRLRVVIDQVASLTDLSALQWHAQLCGPDAGTEI